MPSPERQIRYDSHEEKTCSRLMTHFLDWRPKLGDTYQIPLTEKHHGDFYLPEQNAVLEYHPPVIKWYGAPGVFKRMKRLEKQLSTREFAEVQQLLTEQISHEYFKRRRALMDMSPHIEVQRMRLIVVGDYAELFQAVVKPYATTKVTFKQFKDALERLR